MCLKCCIFPDNYLLHCFAVSSAVKTCATVQTGSATAKSIVAHSASRADKLALTLSKPYTEQKPNKFNFTAQSKRDPEKKNDKCNVTPPKRDFSTTLIIDDDDDFDMSTPCK